MAGLIPFNRKNNDLINSGFDDFRNMLDDFFADNWPIRRSLAADTFKIDVQDMGTQYVVEAEMPGFQKDDIKLSLDDGKLTISVNKEETKEYLTKMIKDGDEGIISYEGKTDIEWNNLSSDVR